MDIKNVQSCLSEWLSFVGILEYYFTRSNVASDCMKKAVLFTMLMPTNYRLIRTLSHPCVPADKSYSQVKALIQMYLVRKDIIEKAIQFGDVLC